MPNYSVFNSNEENLKAYIHGINESKTKIVPIRTDFLGNLNIRSLNSPFGDVITTEKTSLIQLKSVYGISDLRDIINTVNDGTVINDGTEYTLSSGTQADSEATLDSVENGNYLPGYPSEIGLGVRLPSAPSKTQEVRWGYFNNSNGAYFGQDTTGIFVAIKRNSVIQKFYQSEWNVDKLDGTGESGLTLDLSKGHIFQILYSWYGFGVFNYRIVMTNDDNIQETVTIHKYRPINQTSLVDPNLPIRAQVINGTSSPDTSLDLHVSGRQYSILGRYNPNDRITSQSRLNQSIDTTFKPTVSFRRKTDFPVTGRTNTVNVKLEGVDIISTNDILIQVRLNPTLSTSDFTEPNNIPNSETAVQTDISATQISGGHTVYERLASGGSIFSLSLTSIQLFQLTFVENQPITIAAKSLSGTGTINVVFRVREDW